MRDRLIAVLHETLCAGFPHEAEPSPVCMTVADRLVAKMTGSLVAVPADTWNEIHNLLSGAGGFKHLVAEHLP